MSHTTTRRMVALVLKSDTTPCLQPQPLVSLAGWCRWDSVGLQICISQIWKSTSAVSISLNSVWIPSRRQPLISLQGIPNHCREGCENTGHLDVLDQDAHPAASRSYTIKESVTVPSSRCRYPAASQDVRTITESVTVPSTRCRSCRTVPPYFSSGGRPHSTPGCTRHSGAGSTTWRLIL